MVIKKILKKYSLVKIYLSAVSHTAEKSYNEAVSELDKIDQNASKNWAEPYILKGFNLYILKRHVESIESLKFALKHLDNGKYNKHDKAYLNAYCCDLISENYDYLNSQENKELYLNKILFKNIELCKVSRSLKNNFPLIGHPDWVEN